ncbi:MAG TPA: tetratricopeptide repeat protein [Cyclobacteriaceae bacterium]|nr:tetratricopeptide repeat protein [Cyclobacteriaceae bacterium]
MKTILWSGLVSLALVVSMAFSASAQCGADYKWPADKAKAEESLVLLKDNKNNGNFKAAIPPLNWLITNAPDLNKALYIYGADIYDGLAKKETNAAKKAKYADSLMIIYDLRLKNTPCGEEASITNRKALAAYIYLINSDKAKDLLQLMDKAVELNGNDVMDGTLIPYMQTVQINKVKFKTLTDDDVINRYEKITEIIDAKTKKARSEGKPTDKYAKYQSDIDNIFANCGVVIDCAMVKKTLEPKYQANPNDAELAKKIFYYMLQGKCTDDPLWLQTGEKVLETNPDFGIAKNLAIKYLAQENYTKAESLLKKALPLASSNEDKAETLILLGSINAKQGDKAGARELYRQAIGANPANKEAYEKIGDLYMNSFNECAEKDNMADDRKVYLIAYDYYQKAGESKKMAQAKEGFPSKEEIFERNYAAGSATKVGCWINESTIWRTRN